MKAEHIRVSHQPLRAGERQGLLPHFPTARDGGRARESFVGDLAPGPRGVLGNPVEVPSPASGQELCLA